MGAYQQMLFQTWTRHREQTLISSGKSKLSIQPTWTWKSLTPPPHYLPRPGRGRAGCCEGCPLDKTRLCSWSHIRQDTYRSLTQTQAVNIAVWSWGAPGNSRLLEKRESVSSGGMAAGGVHPAPALPPSQRACSQHWLSSVINQKGRGDGMCR